MEPTIDNLKLMAAAMQGGADDAVAYGDAIREAFMTATEEARSGMEELIGLFEKGEANEKFDEWFEGLPESVRESFTSAEKEGLKDLGKFWTGMKSISEGFDWMVLVRGFEGARQWLSGQYGAWAAENEGVWKTIFERAQSIAEVGSDGIITKMQEILSSGLPPETILGQLEDLDELAAEIGEKGGAALADKFAPELQKLQKEGIITMDTMAGLAKSVDGLAESMAGTGEGLNALFGAMDSVAGKGKELVLDFDKLNKVVIDGVGTFVQVGDQLLKVPDAAGSAGNALAGLGIDATDAHTKLTALHTILTLIPQITVAPHIDVDTTDAYTKLSALHQALTAINGLALDAIIITADVQQAGNAIASIVNTLSSLQAPPIVLTADVQQAGNAIASIVNTLSSLKPPPIKIQVDNATALQQINVVKIQLNAIKQTKIPKVTVNNVTALQQIRVVQTQLNAIKQTKIPKVTVNNSQALSQITKVKSALNSLKNITRTITYRYKTVGSPPRGAQSGMHERLGEDTLIAAHKGERVDINPSGGPAIEKPGPTHTIYGGGGGRGRGGGEIVIPVTLMLDNKVLIRTVRRGLVEEVSGAM